MLQKFIAHEIHSSLSCHGNTIYLKLWPSPTFVSCSTKSGGRPGRTYHVMRAAADVMFIQFAHVWVCCLPFTLLSLNSVRSLKMASPSGSGQPLSSEDPNPGCHIDETSREQQLQQKVVGRENAEGMIANSSNSPKNCKQTVPYVWSFFASRFK